MHNNPVLLARFAEKLGEQLEGKQLLRCVSTNPTTIFFHFSNDYVLEIDFVEHHTLFLCPDSTHFPRKNILPQFKSCIGGQVVSVVSPFPDRTIILTFDRNRSIRINAFGRHSGIWCREKEDVVDYFKYKNQPTSEISPQSDLKYSAGIKEFETLNRFISTEMIEELSSRKFFGSSESKQREIWNSYLDQLDHKPIALGTNIQGMPVMSLWPESAEDILSEDIILAFNEFGKQLKSFVQFRRMFTELENFLLNQRKHAEKALAKTVMRLEKMTTAEEYRQTGDLLMANMHEIQNGSEKVCLFNFYTDADVEIRLKKGLSAQKNAERYYQKAKNTHVEVVHLNVSLDRLQSQLSSTDQDLVRLRNAMSHRELVDLKSRLGSGKVEKKKIKSLPYKSFHFEGFDIWVGKSATDNDNLLKLAGKHDLWLHAREVAGSHVLIRNPENKKIGDTLLECAASLAAGHSKNQHESLAAVIYTPLKYVRKFKGSLPGQVRVERETTLLVRPKKKV